MDALTRMPEAFTAGTLVKYQRSFSDFPANQGWTLALFLRGKGVANGSAAANGAAFDVTLAASATAALAPGTYYWTERVTKGTEIYDVDSGVVTVLLNPETAAAGDSLSWEEKTLPLVEAALTALSVGGVQSYQIGTRAVTKVDVPELKRLRGELVANIMRQRNGGRPGRTHLVNFGVGPRRSWPSWLPRGIFP